MAAPQNFRSAFNGFNREDVVHYIEYTNSRHETQLAQLRSELQSAQEELEALRSAPAPEAPQPDTAQLDDLTAKCAALEEENARLRAENAAAAAQPAPEAPSEELEELRAQLAQALAARDEALSQLADARKIAQQELEAYRRAERTERLARERVAQLYDQATGSLADARCRIDAAAKELETLSTQTAAQLATLQEAVQEGTCILQDAAAQLGEMRPVISEE